MKYKFKVDMASDSTHAKILARVARQTEVLEFGPATGYMTKYLKEELDCTVTCIEIDPEAAAKAGCFCAETIVGDIDALEWVERLKGKRFDHILFADVLEHLRNPEEALIHARALLKENGSIIISLPNIAHNAVIIDLMQGKFQYRELGLLDNTHIRFFTKASILEMLKRLDLCPVNWHATLIAPENTEFASNCNVHIALLEQLNDRLDGNAYQYVVDCQRIEDLTPEQLAKVKVEMYQDQTTNSYLEIKSINSPDVNAKDNAKDQGTQRLGLNYGVGFHTYEFALAELSDLKITLQTGGIAAFLQIRSIDLRVINSGTNSENPSSDRLLQIDRQSGFDSLTVSRGAEIVPDIWAFTALLSSEQPEFNLSWQGARFVTQAEQAQKYRLKLDLSISKSVPLEYVQGMFQSLQLLNQQNEKSSKLVRELFQEVSSLRGELNNLCESSSWKLTAPIRKLSAKLRR